MMSGGGKHLLQPLGNRDRPVTPPGAADPHIEITATLALEQGNQKLEKSIKLIEESQRIGVGQHVTPNARVFS